MATKKEKTDATLPASMPPFPVNATTSDMLNYYRVQKQRTWQMVQRIDQLKNREPYGARGEDYQIRMLGAEVHRRDRILSPLGRQICAAILELPNANAQLAMELRYLDMLSLRQVADEMHYTYDGVRSLIYRSIKQLYIIPSQETSKQLKS